MRRVVDLANSAFVHWADSNPSSSTYLPTALPQEQRDTTVDVDAIAWALSRQAKTTEPRPLESFQTMPAGATPNRAAQHVTISHVQSRRARQGGGGSGGPAAPANGVAVDSI